MDRATPPLAVVGVQEQSPGRRQFVTEVVPAAGLSAGLACRGRLNAEVRELVNARRDQVQAIFLDPLLCKARAVPSLSRRPIAFRTSRRVAQSPMLKSEPTKILWARSAESIAFGGNVYSLTRLAMLDACWTKFGAKLPSRPQRLDDSAKARLGFLDTFRTTCLSPNPGISHDF